MKKFYRSATLFILACAITSLTACGGSQGSSNEDNPDSDDSKLSLHASAITATESSITIIIPKTGKVDHFAMSCKLLEGKTLPFPSPLLPGSTETFTQNSLSSEMRYMITVTAYDAGDDVIAENVFCVKTAASGGSVNFTAITTAQELQNISNNLAGNYLLTKNIDLANYEYSWTSIGSSSAGFTGILNGNGYTVSSLYTSQWEDNMGFFSYIDGGAVFSLGLTKVNVFGAGNVGSLAGQNHSGIIYNCYTTGSVASMNNNTGGLVGLNDSGTIIDCYSSASVDGGNSGNPNDSYYHGGLVGQNMSGTIDNCYATGNVSNTISNIGGGLVGYNNAGTISNCHAMGSVGSSNTKFGGLVGENAGTISECYATGSVSGNQYIGGLVGIADKGIIVKCYATGKVTGGVNYTGGLVAYNGYDSKSTSVISNCYATGSVSGEGQVGGLVGCTDYGTIVASYAIGSVSGSNDVGGLLGFSYSEISLPDSYFNKGTADNGYGIAITNTNMKKKETFTAWNFDSIWSLNSSVNNGYPYLTGVTPVQ